MFNTYIITIYIQSCQISFYRVIPAPIVPSPAVIITRPGIFEHLTHFPVNRFPNNLAPSAPYDVPRNPHFYSFTSFSIVSLTPIIHKPASSRDLIIFMISFISSFEIISVVMLDPNIFL